MLAIHHHINNAQLIIHIIAISLLNEPDSAGAREEI